MERHRKKSRGSEPEHGREAVAPARTLNILQRYAAREISARQAAREMGPSASEHDVFAGIVEARMRLPEPSPTDVASEVAALRAL